MLELFICVGRDITVMCNYQTPPSNSNGVYPSWNRCGGRPVGLAKLGFGVWGLGFGKKKGTLGQIGVWGLDSGLGLWSGI